MATIGTRGSIDDTGTRTRSPRGGATHQAYAVLRTAVVVAAVVFGLDKLANVTRHDPRPTLWPLRRD